MRNLLPTLPSPLESRSTVVSELPFLLQVNTTIPPNPLRQRFWKQTADDKHNKYLEILYKLRTKSAGSLSFARKFVGKNAKNATKVSRRLK